MSIFENQRSILLIFLKGLFRFFKKEPINCQFFSVRFSTIIQYYLLMITLYVYNFFFGTMCENEEHNEYFGEPLQIQ